MSASASELSRHLICSREEIKRLTARGVLERGPDGYDLAHARAAYIEHLRAQAHKGDELNTARMRILELKEAKLRGTMMSYPAVDAFAIEIFGLLIVGVEGMIARESKSREERRRWRAAFIGVRNTWAAGCDKMRAELAKDTAA
jgi:hypothetical protein